MKPLNIERILLLFPRRTEKRWESFSIPPSVLFLTGGLEASGFRVDFSYLEVPSLHLTPKRVPSEYDLIGISLFDDFFLEILEFSRTLPPHTLLALGGITPTMAPLETFTFMERANIVFSGEGETLFPALLINLNRGILPEGPWLLRFQEEKINPLSPLKEDLSRTPLSFSPFTSEDYRKGLELVITRGCPRSCIFCTHVHGRQQRRTPLSLIKKWLRKFKSLGGLPVINLADDDIMLEPEYALKFFSLLREEGFELWGIQTSMDSLTNPRAFDAIMAAPFVSKPVLWIGTDVFIKQRAKRLAKKSGESDIENAVLRMEKLRIENYHYWILSDCMSSLTEFTEEFLFVIKLLSKYRHFHLLPNSPFLIPYPYTPSFKRVILKCRDKIVYRKILRKNGIQYPIVLHEKPSSDSLYNLLNPEKSLVPWLKPGEFIELLRNKEIERAASLLISLLREERLFHSELEGRFYEALMPSE